MILINKLRLMKRKQEIKMARTTKTNTAPIEEKSINYISLIDNYYFSADSNNYILYYFNRRNKTDIKTKTQTDEILETYDMIGFYSDLESLIKATIKYINRDIVADGQINTLKECVQQIVNSTEKLMKMLK